MDRMLAGMLQSNAAATRVAREFDAQAVTDVTGFGLAGHLWEMLTAGQVAARVSLQALPLCEGFRDVVASGFRSTLEPANRGIESHIQIDRPGLDHQPEYAALFDPQTSGGLLIAVAAPRAESALTALRGAGLSDAAMIGEVLEAASGTPLLYVDL
jgi:selenide,water dikinase